MIESEHILNVNKGNGNYNESKQLNSKIFNYKNYCKKDSKVVFYCPFNHSYTKIQDYQIKEILDIVRTYQKNSFFIIQIDHDEGLYEEILKMQFKADFENIHKMFDLKLDYCFAPVDELLCFNLSILTNIECDEIEKFQIQIFFSNNGLYIINKDCCDNILSIFRKNFNFKELSREKFFEKVNDKGENLINDVDFTNKVLLFRVDKKFSYNKKGILKIPLTEKFTNNSFGFFKEEIKSTKNINNIEVQQEKLTSSPNINDLNNFKSEETRSVNLGPNPKSGSIKKVCPKVKINKINIPKTPFIHEQTYLMTIETPEKIETTDGKSTKIEESNNQFENKSNFSTDDLIYCLLTFSLGKLEEFADSLTKEAESLKGIYLELSEKERKDFFRRIHNMEISLQLIYQETVIKKKFLKCSKAQFRVYNKLSNNFYFKNTFNFFIELMISKVTQLEMVFEKLENTIRMIKENYSIIIEDNTEKQNIKLNSVMKVLAIMTTVYAPFNIIPNIFGMNVKVPWQDEQSLWPFFGIVMVVILLVLIELYVFKKLKWF